MAGVSSFPDVKSAVDAVVQILQCGIPVARIGMSSVGIPVARIGMSGSHKCGTKKAECIYD